MLIRNYVKRPVVPVKGASVIVVTEHARFALLVEQFQKILRDDIVMLNLKI